MDKKLHFTILIAFSITLFIRTPLVQARAETGNNHKASVAPGGWGTARGDCNNDGKIDIFDIIGILAIIKGEPPYPQGADLDNSGGVDVFDLIALLQVLVSGPPKEPGLEFLVLIMEYLDLLEPVISPWEGDVSGDLKLPYKVYSNKEIKEVLFVFAGDTLTQVEGQIPAVCNTDTLGLTGWPVYVSCGLFPWYARVTGTEGNWRDTSGIAEIKPFFNWKVDIDFNMPLISQEIQFPLVLKGAEQRFKISQECPNSQMTVDLNRMRADSVVFPDIDSLATAIMEDLAENDSLWQHLHKFGIISRLVFVSPAF